MAVIFWWMALVWLVVIAAVVLVIRAQRKRRASVADGVPVAHTERLTALPGYRSAMARYRVLLYCVVGVVIVMLVASISLTMRFANVTLFPTDLRNRDIVLCLDVSGSMVDYDAQVLEKFSELATQFEGERLSLVIFNASAVTYFPLTTDLDYIERQFATLQTEFESPEQSYYSGTLVGDGSSLVGDGLASCALRFDAQGEERSRSVILVTDNLVAGQPVFTLPEAGELALSREIRVFGVNPGDTSSKDYQQYLADEFEQVVTATGGGYFALDDAGTIPSIVDRITSQQAALSRGPVQIIYEEATTWATTLLALGLIALFALAWRLRR